MVAARLTRNPYAQDRNEMVAQRIMCILGSWAEI